MFISFLFDQTGRFLASGPRSCETSNVWGRRAGEPTSGLHHNILPFSLSIISTFCYTLIERFSIN